MLLLISRSPIGPRPRIAKLLGLLVAGTLLAGCQEALAAAGPRPSPKITQLRLELRPWTTPRAIALRLDAAGNAERWHFVPTALAIDSLRRSTLSPSLAASLLAVPSAPDLPPSAEAEEGDLLTLELLLDDGSSRRRQTFRHRLAPEVGAWVDTLLAASAGWPETEHAAAYLRAEPISDDRLAAIRRRGLIEPLPLEELPAAARTAAEEAIESLHVFVAVDPTIHDALRPLAQHGAELVIAWEGRGFTLTPYRGREASR